MAVMKSLKKPTIILRVIGFLEVKLLDSIKSDLDGFLLFLRERIGMTPTLEILAWEIIMRLKYWLIWLSFKF